MLFSDVLFVKIGRMAIYTDLYAKKIDYYQQDYIQLKEYLDKLENVAYASSPSTGEERFFEYAAFQLNKENDYQAINIGVGVFDFDDLIKNVRMSNKCVVVFIPYFYKGVSHSLGLLRKIKAALAGRQVLSVVKMPWDVHVEPQKYFEDATIFANLLVRPPLTLEQTKEAMEVRKALHGWPLDEVKPEDMQRLTGGLLRLIKRVGSYYDKNQCLDLKDLVNQPSIMAILAQLSELYSTLPANVLEKMGLITQDGYAKSEMLRNYLELHSFAPRVELKGKMLALFNLLYENRNKLVTDEMIDKIVRRGRTASLWANYKMVSRLKERLNGRYNIRTARGKGYVLSEV